jgi:hypothetical protein
MKRLSAWIWSNGLNERQTNHKHGENNDNDQLCSSNLRYPAKQAGGVSVLVRGPDETKPVIEVIIACLGDDEQARSLEMDYHPA